MTANRQSALMALIAASDTSVSRTSNHTRARRRPRGWHQNLRRERLRQKRARRAQRGKR